MFTPEQIAKAIENHNKRLQYNKAWRERNPEKVKAIRSEYNKRRWAMEKAILAQAKAEGKM